MKASIQRIKLIELLKANYADGVNARIFYNKEYYRYAERLRELRKMGWVFAKFKQPLGGHNFYRFFIAYDPHTKTVNASVPAYATWWNDKGRMKVHEVKYYLTGQTSVEHKNVKYEYFTDSDGYDRFRVVGA